LEITASLGKSCEKSVKSFYRLLPE